MMATADRRLYYQPVTAFFSQNRPNDRWQCRETRMYSVGLNDSAAALHSVYEALPNEEHAHRGSEGMIPMYYQAEHLPAQRMGKQMILTMSPSMRRMRVRRETRERERERDPERENGGMGNGMAQAKGPWASNHAPIEPSADRGALSLSMNPYRSMINQPKRASCP